MTFPAAPSRFLACRIAHGKVIQRVLASLFWVFLSQLVTAPSVYSAGVIIEIATAKDLIDALRNATGGETLRLAAGDYGKLRLVGKDGSLPNYSSPVTITSADPKQKAVFRSVSLTKASNLKFIDLDFDYVADYAASQSASPFKLMESSNITFQNVVFDGDFAKGISLLEDGYATGRGLIVRKSENITVQGSLFRNWYRASAFGSVKGLQLLNNEVVGSSSDGFDFAKVENVLISGNHLHDFRKPKGSSAHADMIQFWTSGTDAPSRNITIVNNFIDMGAGSSAQSIFMRNERVDQGQAGAEMFYQNVTIANNVIANRHQHGITVGETDGLLIDRNTVIQKAGPVGDKEIPLPTIKVSKNAVNVKVINNIAAALAGSLLKPQPGWDVQNNLVVQSNDTSAANYVGKILANPLLETTSARADFMAASGGRAAKLKIGAMPEGAWLQPAPAQP
jgi:Right handed beta helix region